MQNVNHCCERKTKHYTVQKKTLTNMIVLTVSNVPNNSFSSARWDRALELCFLTRLNTLCKMCVPGAITSSATTRPARHLWIYWQMLNHMVVKHRQIFSVGRNPSCAEHVWFYVLSRKILHQKNTFKIAITPERRKRKVSPTAKVLKYIFNERFIKM